MKALFTFLNKSSGIFYLYGAMLFVFSCHAPQTLMQHGGNFSNIRAEVFLKDGSTVFGYATLHISSNNQYMTIKMPGVYKEKKIPIINIDRLKIEEDDYFVKNLNTPSPARRDGKPASSLAVIKRISEPFYPLQVYEYKYQVRNPKSPINKMITSYYVSFDPNQNGILVEMGTKQFKQQWEAFVESSNANSSGKPYATSKQAPASAKGLLDAIKEGLEANEAQKELTDID